LSLTRAALPRDAVRRSNSDTVRAETICGSGGIQFKEVRPTFQGLDSADFGLSPGSSTKSKLPVVKVAEPFVEVIAYFEGGLRGAFRRGGGMGTIDLDKDSAGG
jgi:hypothetical protein